MRIEFMANFKRLRVIFSGRVQGVGMRATVKMVARRYQVTGFVRNLPDGTVEVQVQGDVEVLDELLKSVHTSMPGYIRHVERNWMGEIEAEKDFRIEYF